MYDKIVAPTDGSGVAKRAGEYAIALADQFDATLEIIHIAESSDKREDSDPVSTLADAASESGLTFDTAVIEKAEEVHRSIIDYAAENEGDLIVMGTHGRTGINRFLLGSVAEQTLRESPIPVVTVHEDTEIDPAIEHVLVPTDGSDSATVAAEHAIDLALETEATLHALYVVESGLPVTAEEIAETALDTATEAAEQAGLDDVETATRHGRVHQEIAGYTSEAGIDCVVMGTHGRTGLRRYLLGSVTERTVRFSPVPVFSVKPERLTATVEFLDYTALQRKGWSVDDDDLFEKAASAEFSEQTYGKLSVEKGEYILEAAEAADYDWPFYCRAGACVNCVAILYDGEVEMEAQRSLSDEEIEAENLRLTCVATPTTEDVKLVYNAKNLDSLADRVI